MYSKSTVYIIGHAKTNTDNAITDHFKLFFIGFVVDVTTDEIIDLACTSTISTTERFIASIFVGRKLDDYYEHIEEEIKMRYFGSSQRAILVAYKEAIKKYIELKAKYY